MMPFVVGQIVRCTFRPHNDRSVVGRVYNIINGRNGGFDCIYIEDIEGAHFVSLANQTILSGPEEVEAFRAARRAVLEGRRAPSREPQACRFQAGQIVRSTEEATGSTLTGVGRVYHTEYNYIRDRGFEWTVFVERADHERFLVNEAHVVFATLEEVAAYTQEVDAEHQRAGERVYAQRQRQTLDDRRNTLSHMSRYRASTGFGIGDYVQVVRGASLTHGTRGHIVEMYCRTYPEGPRWHVTLEVEHGNRVRSYVSNIEMVTMVTNLSGPMTYMQHRYMDTLMSYETDAEAQSLNAAINHTVGSPQQRFTMFMTCYTCGIRDHEMRVISAARNFIKQHEGHFILMYEQPGAATDGRGME